MLPAPNDHALLPSRRRAAHAFRRRIAWLSVLATIAATLLVSGAAAPTQAVQASGDEVPTWSTGWSWTYQTVFNYSADGTNVTINENVTYTVAGVENYQGQPAYKLNLTGTITGGGGSVAVDGVGNATLSNFSGNVSGTRFMRRSDLALLKETQQQNLSAKAQVSIISQNITATINLSMDPTRGWRLIQFPTEAGNSWTNDVDVAYSGGFSYDAGSLGGTGASDFDGTLELDGPTTVANENLSVPAGTFSTRRAVSQSTDGATKATMWHSPTHRSAARLLLQIPLDGGSLTLDQKLASASTPAPATSLTSTTTPSLSCAGGDVTVTGRLSTGAAGVPVTVALDRSPVTPGASTTTTATTTAGGNYTATLQAPAASDGYQRSGIRGSWGIVATAAGATSVSTVVVTPKNCSDIDYTGAVDAPQGTDATVSAKLVDKTGATVSGKTVTFALSGGATATATTNGSGIAQTTIAVAGPPRAATITASYAGDAQLEPASTSTPFTVGAIATITTVTADPSVVTIGDPVRFTSTVTPTHGSTPTGTVQFRVDGSDFGAAVALDDGAATSPALSTLGLGDHVVVAVYNGTSDHVGSTSAAVTFRVREPLLVTSTTSSANPSNAVYGQPVTLGATVSTVIGTPTGEVVFSVAGLEVGRAGLAPDGTASVTVTDLAVGSNQVVATYSGDDVRAGSAATPRNVTVSKAAVTVALAATDTTTVTGEAVGYSATVTVTAPGGGNPDGSVQLVVDGADVGAPVELVGGTAAFAPLTSLTSGGHTVAVTYAGSARYQGDSDQLTQEVTAAETAVSLVANPTPSVQDQEVQLTASVAAVSPGSGAPTGTVTFYDGADSIGAAPLTGSGSGSTATLDVADLAPGAHQLTARYAGDTDYEASASAEVAHTVIEGTAVIATSTALTSSASPSTYGQLITFRAEVTADDDTTPSGSVQFSVDGQDIGEPVAVDGSGVALSAPYPSPTPGDHTVIAAFTAQPGYTGSGAILTQTVEAAEVDIDLTSSDGDSAVGADLTFTAVITSAGGTPTGLVQFAIDGQPLGAAVELVDGEAVSPVVGDLAPGDHTVTALYGGDANFRPATAQLDQDVVRVATTTTLEVAQTTVTYGSPVSVTATVVPASGTHGAPTGSVRFLSDGEEVARVALSPQDDGSAVATAQLSGLTAGSHALKAVYVENATFGHSASPVVDLTVAKRATALEAQAAILKLTTPSMPLGQLRATLTAGDQPLSGVPVQFTIGTKVVCTSVTNQSGLASCNAGTQLVQLLLAGGYDVTYAGDANHLSSTARGVNVK